MRAISKLNLNDNPATFANGDIKYAKNIVATIDQKAIRNEDGFSHIITYAETIVGKVEIPNGYVIFLKGVNMDKIVCIDKDTTKTISSPYFNFNINRPIKGRYTFNSNNDLYITLTEGVNSPNETRIINITKSPTYLSKYQVDILSLIPNIKYPTINTDIISEGSLLVGTYQVAISYQVEEAIYTNYSILSEPIYVFGTLKDHNKIGTSIQRSIKLTFTNLDTRYTKFKIGFLYKGEDAFEKSYETDDLYTSITTYNISNMDSLSSTDISNLTIGSISYIKDEDHVNFNGRLIRTNVQTVNYSGIDDVMNTLASNIKVGIQLVPSYTSGNTYEEPIKITKHFKEGEHYVLYVGCIDYKGNFINAYPIPWKSTDNTESTYADVNNTNVIHKIPYITYNTAIPFDPPKYLTKLYTQLPSNINNILGEFASVISSFCYFYAEHNLNNSKIIGQGFVIRDTHRNDFSDNQRYEFPFNSHKKLRFYSFEHLFNKSTISNVHLYNHNNTLFTDDDFISTLNVHAARYFKSFNFRNSRLNSRVNVPISSVDYIDNDNTVVDNIAGDSFSRLHIEPTDADLLFGSSHNDWPTGDYYYTDHILSNVSGHTGGSTKLSCIADLVSNANYFYDDIYKQRLVICSPIIDVSKTSICELSGDFFYDPITLRFTTPESGYKYGTNDLDLQGETHVHKVIVTVELESRFNIRARYNGVNDYQKIFNITSKSNEDVNTFLDIPYKYDNFINASEGKGYSLSCHNNGYNNIIYDKELDIRYNHFNRIVRSVVNSTESKGIAWRIFNANDYKDLPIERGRGITIEADERAIYIQQEYALFLAAIRDQISNDPNSETYLGSSDLFDRPPMELLYDKNGYIGSDSRFNSIITPFGYVVVDTILKNIFLVKLSQVKRLNDPDVEEWFRDNLVSGLTNPYNKKGISLLYDDTIKSLFLTQQGSKDFTIHYNFSRNGGWLSFHDYIADGYISNRLATYCIKNNGIYKRHANNKGIFFDNTLNTSEVIYIYNNQFELYKHILGVSWDTFIKKDGAVVYNFTFDRLIVYNDTQCTGEILLNAASDWFDTESGVYKRDQWYFNNIVDIVKNDKLPFIDSTGNIISDNIDTNLEWFTKNNFISKFVYIKFGYDNKFTDIHSKNQLEIILNSYDVNAVKSIR